MQSAWDDALREAWVGALRARADGDQEAASERLSGVHAVAEMAGYTDIARAVEAAEESSPAGQSAALQHLNELIGRRLGGTDRWLKWIVGGG